MINIDAMDQETFTRCRIADIKSSMNVASARKAVIEAIKSVIDIFTIRYDDYNSYRQRA